MDGMILHKGGYLVAREQLRTVPTPTPTASHWPIPHDLLLEEVDRALRTVGLEVAGEKLALAREGQRFFGVLTLKRPDDNGEYASVLGVRNSHDKAFCAQFVTGSSVFVCDNLAFSGSFLLSRKHTRHIVRDLPELVMRGMAQAQVAFIEQHRRLDTYRLTSITDRDANALIIEMFRQQVFGVTRIPAVVEQWYEPKHVEHADDGNTIWRLMNAVTEALKVEGGIANARLPKQTIKMHALLDHACGLEPLKEAA